MQFIETHVFTRQVKTFLTEGSYRALQLAILLRPEQGALVREGAGLRKLRWKVAGRGKRGGLRILYYLDERTETTYMLFIYSKIEQGDLTRAQVRQLAKIIREELK